MKKLEILKILVPVDFSANSIKALKMASSVAVIHSASIHLLHVTDNDYDLYETKGEPGSFKFRQSTKRLSELAKSVIDEYRIPCFYTLEYGAITHTILKYAIDFCTDIIIMGKNGSNGSRREYAGTQCCQVAEKSGVPVLIVPEETNKFSFEKVLFPVRPLLSVIGKYEAIRSFLHAHKPEIKMLNLRNPDNSAELHIIHKINFVLAKKLSDDSIFYSMDYYFRDDHFEEHILSVLNNDGCDLAIITSEPSASENDFYLGYYTQKIIHGCQTPLLLVHSDYPLLGTDEILNKLEKSLG